MSLSKIDNFGDVAAEDDAVLQYFLSTKAADTVIQGKALLVLGRKGTGKTAIVRYVTETQGANRARSLNMRGYPWNVHAARIDHGASDAETYVSSWRYLLAIQLASIALAHPQSWKASTAQALKNFLTDNYGVITPALSDILRPPRLKLSKISFLPSVMGNQLGGIELDRLGKDLQFGLELSALSNSIIEAGFQCLRECGSEAVSLHFDELDQGIATLDQARRSMIIGLIVAARDLKRQALLENIEVFPVVYLRSDIWNDLQFSDKNKITQTAAYHLEWDSESLLDLINLRLAAKLGKQFKWENISESDRMRGTQSKWNHILARTFLRPRDVISYLNVALEIARARDKDFNVFTNPDISGARDRYSNYLKAELDDEIVPHWNTWAEALRACSAIGTLSFTRTQFEKEYPTRRSQSNNFNQQEALQALYQFSVVGYKTPRQGGGSAWVFQYSDAHAGYDSVASQFKVHPGLKEFAKLREDRATSSGDIWTDDLFDPHH